MRGEAGEWEGEGVERVCAGPPGVGREAGARLWCGASRQDLAGVRVRVS